jgi:hypothetical protein
MNKLQTVTKILLAVWLLATLVGAITPQLLDANASASETRLQDGTSKSQPIIPISLRMKLGAVTRTARPIIRSLGSH